MKIGILQAGHVPEEMIAETGNYGDVFQRFLQHDAFEFQVYNVVDMDFPSHSNDAQGWLITGSRHGVYDPLPFIDPLKQLVRDIYAQNLPLVGVCFGHQIIAQALGGQVEKYAHGWSIGHTDYLLDGQHISLNAWHQDQVTQCPQDASVLGSSDFCKYAFLGYKNRVFSVQAHPEFNSAFVKGLIDYRGKGNVPDDLLAEAKEKLDHTTHSDYLRNRIIDLFQSALVTA